MDQEKSHLDFKPSEQYYRKHHGKSCQQDWNRVVALYLSSIKSQAFESPEPLTLHLKDGMIDYECFPKGQVLAHELFKALITRRKDQISYLNMIFDRVGHALAQFHQNYKLPDNGSFSLYRLNDNCLSKKKLKYLHTELDESVSAYYHGDFGTGNVWLPEGGGGVVLFDPVPSTFCPVEYINKTTIYYDIGHMVSTLWFLYPIWLYPFIEWNIPEALILSFLHGYENESEQSLNESVVFYVALWLNDAYMRKNKDKFAGLKGLLRKLFYLKRRLGLVEAINSA